MPNNSENVIQTRREVARKFPLTIPTSWYMNPRDMATVPSKERLLAVAKDLFLARGYAATTVDAICEQAQLTKGSFYYSFESKEALGLAVLDWSLRQGVQLLATGPYTQVADPGQKAFAFLEHLERCAPALWSGGCLLGSFATELADTNPRMQQAVAAMFQAVADFFAQQLQPLAAPGGGESAPSASEQAETLLGLLEGSIILAKAHRDPSRVPKAIRRFRLALAARRGP